MATSNIQIIYAVTVAISPALQAEASAYDIAGCYRRHHHALYKLFDIVQNHKKYNLLPTTVAEDHVILHENADITSQLWVDIKIEHLVLQ